MTGLTHDFVSKALADHRLDFGNNILYRLCKEEPSHTRADVVIAKVWLIGRAYAAAIERRNKYPGEASDVFYSQRVAPAFRELDSWFADYRAKNLTEIQLHKRFVVLLKGLTGLEKRSLASKYLHFHFPDNFYIYDSYADAAVRKLCRLLGAQTRSQPHYEDADETYAQHFARCEQVAQHVNRLIDRPPSPREVDKVLLRWSAMN